MGVVDRPDIVLVVEFDFAPICEGFIAQIPIAKATPNTICLTVGI
jgi:hypothetical protein